MANSRRGLLKVPVAAVQSAEAIPDTTSIDTRDLGAKRMRDFPIEIDRLALAGPDSFAALTRNENNGVDLKVTALP
jgi:hypothetical protein